MSRGFKECHALLAMCLGAAALSVGGCALDAHGLRAEGAFNRTLSVSGPADLEVRTGSGDIQIRTGAPGVVQVRGHVWCMNIWAGLQADKCVHRVEMSPPVEQSGNVIRLGGLPQQWTWAGVRIDFDVTVPPDAHVRTRSGSGDQMVDSLEGPVDASAGSGDIRIGRTSGNVRVSTGSGDIELAGNEGPVLARAASGSISAVALKSDIEAHTASGRVSVSQTASGRTDVTSGSGSITVSNAHGPLQLRTASGAVTVDGEPAAHWSVRSASGNVTLHVDADAGFDLAAHSGSGRIDSAHPVMMTGRVSRRELSGRVRGGGPRIEVTTASGAIRIR